MGGCNDTGQAGGCSTGKHVPQQDWVCVCAQGHMYAWRREAAVTESFSATNANVLSVGNPYAYLWHL